MTNNTARTLVTGAAVVALALSGCASSDEGGTTFSGAPIRWIMPSGAGGGNDATSRQLLPFLAEQLDTNITVENHEGGGYAIGSQVMLTNGADCTSILTHGIPQLMFSYMTQSVDYDLSSFAPVGGMTIEPGVLRVRNDAPWQTINEFVEDAKQRPGQIKVSVSDVQTPNYIALLQMEEELGIDLNIIDYDGGGPARTSVVSGEVDANHAGVFNSLAVADDTRVLAVFQPENKWPEVTDNAPAINDALGVDLPPNAANYVVYASAECRDNNPERYQLLVDALKTAMEDPAYLETLAELGEASKVSYLSPDELQALTEQSQSDIEQLLETNPNAFSG